jgi:hypothetical protein
MKKSSTQRKSSRAKKMLMPLIPHDSLEVNRQQKPEDKSSGLIEFGKSIALELAEAATRSRKKTFHEFIEQVNCLVEGQVFYVFCTDKQPDSYMRN